MLRQPRHCSFCYSSQHTIKTCDSIELNQLPADMIQATYMYATKEYYQGWMNFKYNNRSATRKFIKAFAVRHFHCKMADTIETCIARISVVIFRMVRDYDNTRFDIDFEDLTNEQIMTYIHGLQECMQGEQPERPAVVQREIQVDVIIEQELEQIDVQQAEIRNQYQLYERQRAYENGIRNRSDRDRWDMYSSERIRNHRQLDLQRNFRQLEMRKHELLAQLSMLPGRNNANNLKGINLILDLEADTETTEETAKCNKDCCVCFEEKPTNTFVTLNCNHEFCGPCVMQILKTTHLENTCSLCRQKISGITSKTQKMQSDISACILAL